jgi:hypothetical protein
MNDEVKVMFTAQSFRKVMDPKHVDNFVLEIALRFISKFYDSVQKGIIPPIPNLGKTSLATKRGHKDNDKLLELLIFALSQSDRENFMKLRAGEISLN